MVNTVKYEEKRILRSKAGLCWITTCSELKGHTQFCERHRIWHNQRMKHLRHTKFWRWKCLNTKSNPSHKKICRVQTDNCKAI